MLSKKEEIKRLWRETFGDTRDYVEMYFDRVYRDDDAMTVTVGEGNERRLVSSLLLQPYRMTFGSATPDGVGVSYIAGAATLRQARGKGYMSMLINDALRRSFVRGDMLCALIPAEDWLTGFYSRFGFRTVFYSDCMLYTALHEFEVGGEWVSFDDHFDPRIYDCFCRFESESREWTVCHDRRDFLNILDDMAMDRGAFAAVGPAGSALPTAMAWCVPDSDGHSVTVTKVMGSDETSRRAALRELRRSFPGLPFKVLMTPAEHTSRFLIPRGMGRVVSVMAALGPLASENPGWKSRIRVSDPIIPENNQTFVIGHGKVSVDDNPGSIRPDFDIDIATFTAILFSSADIASILRFPSRRPDMYLMLD
ncbi:MAG: GNAT family N-acetyltransferase [Clostridium sp.]|nr:GNAT family N-acetyltransferase [Clostridium sp.]